MNKIEQLAKVFAKFKSEKFTRISILEQGALLLLFDGPCCRGVLY